MSVKPYTAAKFGKGKSKLSENTNQQLRQEESYFIVDSLFHKHALVSLCFRSVWRRDRFHSHGIKNKQEKHSVKQAAILWIKNIDTPPRRVYIFVQWWSWPYVTYCLNCKIQHAMVSMLDEDGNSGEILERSENHLFSHTAKMSSEVEKKV